MAKASNENTKSNPAAFGGYLYYVSILKGVGLYTTNFTVSYAYPTSTTILINAATTSGVVNVSTVSSVPSAPIVSYSVTYNGNTNTSGSVPVDSSAYPSNDSVNVIGNTGVLKKTGYSFEGWNTYANGLGISYLPSSTFVITSNIILYAIWVLIPIPVTPILRMSLYTNNSQVFYKPNSLGSGVGGVRNHRAIKHRT